MLLNNNEISKIKQKNINKHFIKCNWDGSVMDLNTDDSNILGKSGKLIVNVTILSLTQMNCGIME